HADVWHEMGRVLVTLHRPDDARRAFSSAIEHRADHAEARYALAQLLHEMGDAEGALRETQHALKLAPVRAESRLTVGIELQQECPDAVGSLDLLALRAINPLEGAAIDVATISAMLPDVPRRIDNKPAPVVDVFGGASGVFASETSALLSANVPPTSADQLFRDADSFAARSLHGEALERYALVRRNPELSTQRLVWRRAALGEARSKCLLARGGEALDVLEKLLHECTPADEDEPETLALLAAAHAAEWRDTTTEPRRARAAIARFLRLEPGSAALLHFVGNVAVALREDSLALVLFRRALAVDPMRPTPRVAIARLLRLRKDVLAARLELVAALAVAPQLRDALLELARLHCSTDRAIDALPVLVSHLNRMPGDADALTLLATALLQVGRENDARLAVTRALRHNPDHVDALTMQATLLSAHGRTRDSNDRLQFANSARVAAR
ncbi:MAG: tetratricopeptide repeat protein, partial [Gemmatimonas sp.]